MLGRIWTVTGVGALVGACVSLPLVVGGCSPISAKDGISSIAPNSLVFSATDGASDRGFPSNVLTLGTLPQGGQHESRIWLRNFSDRAATITGVSTTCDCLTLEGLPTEVGPHQSVPVTLKVNLADEASFAGELEVVAQLAATGVEPAPLKVRISVAPVSNDTQADAVK